MLVATSSSATGSYLVGAASGVGARGVAGAAIGAVTAIGAGASANLARGVMLWYWYFYWN